MPDHEVHEIQLNGKQLVFMFMAATVVSVVIFLCGVMVGRGVRQPVADTLAVATGSSIDPTTPPDTSSTKPAPAAEPAPDRENLTYGKRLEATAPLSEPLKLTETKPEVAPAVPEKPVAPKAVAQERKPGVVPERKTDTDAVAATFSEPPGKGFVVQVRAFPERSAAEALAGRLQGKKYNAFVTVNSINPGGKFRVRVGKFATRREAGVVMARLKQEEHFDPWLTH